MLIYGNKTKKKLHPIQWFCIITYEPTECSLCIKRIKIINDLHKQLWGFFFILV